MCDEDRRSPHDATSLPVSFAPLPVKSIRSTDFFVFSVALLSNIELDQTFMLPLTPVILGKNFYQLFREFLHILRDPGLFF